ncbi:MAG TPA: type VI secretion system tube protein TssD [Chryseolinea sp.]
MSFLARLFVDDQARDILNADYLFHKTKDLLGQPQSQALGGQLDITLESTGQDALWYDWMLSAYHMKKGYIRFYNRDGLSKLFDFEFWDCFCTGLHETFRSTGATPMTLQLSLSPGIFRIRDLVYEKPWKVSDPFSEGKPVVLNSDEEMEAVEPRITGAFVNTQVLSVDNQCENCVYLRSGLGRNCRPDIGYYNGVEIQFYIAGRLEGYKVEVTRTLSFCDYVNGKIVTKSDVSDGPDKKNMAITDKIYSIDMPGYNTSAVNVTSGVLSLAMIGNFVEMAIINGKNGAIISEHSVKWHTKIEIRRSSPDGIFKYTEGSIGKGHVEFI